MAHNHPLLVWDFETGGLLEIISCHTFNGVIYTELTTH